MLRSAKHGPSISAWLTLASALFCDSGLGGAIYAGELKADAGADAGAAEKSHWEASLRFQILSDSL